MVTWYYSLHKPLDMDNLLAYLNQQYPSELGYQFVAHPLGEAATVSIGRRVGGIHMITGLGERVDVTLTVQNGYLYVTAYNDYWADKIVSGVIGALGFVLVWFLLISCGIGLYRQSKLPGRVEAHIRNYLLGYGIATPYGYPPPPPGPNCPPSGDGGERPFPPPDH